MTTGAISGQISTSSTIQYQISPGTGLSNYTIAVNPSNAQAYAPGTGANQANKVFQAAYSLAAAATAIDLTATNNLDGSTGFSHAREILIFNDSATDGQTVTLDAPANTFAPFLGGTSPTFIIPAGACLRLSKPLGTNGWTVDATHKLLTLDPGANTIPARVVVIGD